MNHKGRSRLVGLPVNPTSLHVYWVVDDERRRLIADHFLTNWHALPLCLCVYDVTDVWFDGTNAPLILQVEVSSANHNWYFHELNPARNYMVDLATRVNQKLFTVLRSNLVSLPPAKSGTARPSIRFTKPVAPQSAATISRPRSEAPAARQGSAPSPMVRFEGIFDGYHLIDSSGEDWLRSEEECQKDT